MDIFSLSLAKVHKVVIVKIARSAPKFDYDHFLAVSIERFAWIEAG